MFQLQPMVDRHAQGLRARAAVVLAALALGALAADPLPAGGEPPDRPGGTPVTAGKSLATTAVSAGRLRSGLARLLRRARGRSGAWVGDLSAGTTLFGRSARRPRLIASNMKLFTTATALGTIGPDERLETQLWAIGEIEEGVLSGDLVLRGGGDPGLGRRGLARLAGQVLATGLRRVTGGLFYDESVFDRKRSVPQRGITGGPYLGRLSGLSYGGGAAADPARLAARVMISLLRKRGLKLRKGTGVRRALPGAPGHQLLAELGSAPLSRLVAVTNTFSSNFYAEMLLKAIGAELLGRGTTRAGGKLVAGYASQRGARVRAVNGSGLSRAVRAAPRAIGRLLASMLDEDEEVSEGFLDSLAVAGRSGTLARRMRGTAAQDRCLGKTGTLTAVSAMSGYCFAGDRVLGFAILMNRVDVYRARVLQDRMAALIARYRP